MDSELDLMKLNIEEDETVSVLSKGESDDDTEWSDDSEFYAEDEDGYHEMNPKEQEEYYDRLNETDGFDMPYFPKAIAFGIIVPVGNLFSNMAVSSEVHGCAMYALEQHNAQVNKNYKFHEIVKANVCGVAGVIYYITFQAEDPDNAGPTQNEDQGVDNVDPATGGLIVEFEAEVFLRLPDKHRVRKMEVMLFRPKGSKMIEGCCGTSTGTSTE